MVDISRRAPLETRPHLQVRLVRPLAGLLPGRPRPGCDRHAQWRPSEGIIPPARPPEASAASTAVARPRWSRRNRSSVREVSKKLLITLPMWGPNQ